jgi:hypothetical protein
MNTNARRTSAQVGDGVRVRERVWQFGRRAFPPPPPFTGSWLGG